MFKASNTYNYESRTCRLPSGPSAVPASYPAARAAPDPPQPADPSSLVEYGSRRVLVVAGVMLAALLQTVDLTIVNVALPTIQGNLGATVDEATWVLTAYVVANVVVIPLTPWLQVRFGRKNYFLASIAGFTAASILCGMATSLNALILYRVIQGAFGGGLLATAQVVLRDTFPVKQIGLSQSIFALGTILGPSIGPTIGGVLVDDYSWPWIFDVNLVPGILAFVILWRCMRDNTKPQRAPVDVPGIALLIVAVSCLQYVLDQGQRDDWFSDQTIVICAFLAVVATALFIWWELRTERADRRFARAAFAGRGRGAFDRRRLCSDHLSKPAPAAAVYGRHSRLHQHARRLADRRARAPGAAARRFRSDGLRASRTSICAG